MIQKQYIKCATHPGRDISMIYMGKECKFDTRLACIKCLEEYSTLNGFMDYFDILENVNYTLKSNKGPYCSIEDYLNVINIDLVQQIEILREQFERSIGILKMHFDKGIDKFKKFQLETQAAHEKFSQLIGHSNFKAKTKALSEAKDQNYQKLWIEMEDSLETFINNFHNGDNDEIKELIGKLDQNSGEEFIDMQAKTKAIDQFKQSISKYINQIEKELNKIHALQLPISPLISDPQFSKQLLRSTNINSHKFQLIYKGTKDGMSSVQFWAKCNNKTNLMIICKGQNQHVFGGYSPCIWRADNTWKQDDTLSTFLFSATQRQIYKLNKGNTLMGHQSYGPYFIDFQVPQNFQNCTSVLKNFTAEGVVVANPQTHLMGVANETLIEMEVYQIE